MFICLLLLEENSFSSVKLGFLGDIGIAGIVYDLIKHYKLKNIVVDPVIVGKRADKVLVDTEFLNFYINCLFPLAELVTPNWNEACVLTQCYYKEVFTSELMKQKAQIISDLCKCNVLISGKSEHNKNTDCLVNYCTKEVFCFDGKTYVFNKPVIGLGCKFSTAIAAYLGLGLKLNEVIAAAKLLIIDYLECIEMCENQACFLENKR